MFWLWVEEIEEKTNYAPSSELFYLMQWQFIRKFYDNFYFLVEFIFIFFFFRKSSKSERKNVDPAMVEVSQRKKKQIKWKEKKIPHFGQSRNRKRIKMFFHLWNMLRKKKKLKTSKEPEADSFLYFFFFVPNIANDWIWFASVLDIANIFLRRSFFFFLFFN